MGAAGIGLHLWRSLRSGSVRLCRMSSAAISWSEPRDLETYRKAGMRAMQSTPLVSRTGRLLGMISTHWSKTTPART